MKISVIIPVYNAEKYLDTCLQSILEQSFTDFELILVNDGSTDNSGAICESYAINDNRIKVLHKENGGVSSARNLGLKMANGEWIAFIDSDDYISENYFTPIFKYSTQDLILLDIYRLRDNERLSFVEFEEQKLNIHEFLTDYQLYPHFPGPCGKFYRRKIILENQLTFNEKLDFGEDSVFNLHFVFKCKNIALTNSTSYNYRYTEDGLSKKKPKIVEEEKYFYKNILAVLETNTSDRNIISKNIRYPLTRFLTALLRSNYSNKEKVVILKIIIKKHKDFLINFTERDRVYRVPLKMLIKYEQIKLFVLLSKNTYKFK